MDLSSGLPFWLVKHGMPFDYARLDKSIKTDVVVIGAGISGALMAYELSKAGIPCVVVDGRSIGMGSSCASTSLLQYEIDTALCDLSERIGFKDAARCYELCSLAIDELGSIAEKIGFDEFYYRKSLYYAAEKKDESFLRKEFESRKEAGFKVEYLEPGQLNAEFGFNAPGAILSDQGGETNAYSFSHCLHQHSKKQGVEIYDRTMISKIKESDGGYKLTTEDGYTIAAKKIVNATGYEVVNFINKKIVALKSTYAVISERVNEQTDYWKGNALIWNTADPYLYMRTTPDCRILIGGRDEDFYNPNKRDKLIASKTRQLVKDFQKVFPNIEFKPEFSWTGTFGETKDGLPFIGSYKNKNRYFALGFGGNGITFSQIAAQLITKDILGKKNADLDLFSFDRV